MRPSSRGYYIKYNTQRGLGGGIDWSGGISSAISGVAQLGSSIAQAFTIKKQVDGMIEQAKIQADATKYVADTNVDIAKIQQEVALKAQEFEKLKSTKANYNAIIFSIRDKIASLVNKVVLARNQISPNLKYIFLKQEIDITSFTKICNTLYNSAVTVVSQYADKIKQESLITTTITSANDEIEVQSIFNDMSVLYRNQILSLQNILLACESMSEKDRAIYFLSLYFFDKNNYAFGIYANQLTNNNLRLSDIVASKMPDDLVNVDVNADWQNNATKTAYPYKDLDSWAAGEQANIQSFFKNDPRQAKWNSYFDHESNFIDAREIVNPTDWSDKNKKYSYQRGVSRPAKLGVLPSLVDEQYNWSYWCSYHNISNRWKNGELFQNFNLVNDWNITQSGMKVANGNAHRLVAFNVFLKKLKSLGIYKGDTYEPPQSNEALGKLIQRKKEFLATQQSSSIDVLQVFFNELRSIVSQSDIIETLQKSITQYYDYEKDTYFIEEAYFENTITTMLFSSVDKIKYIFDNIYTAMRESIQIRFLKGLFGSVETLTYNNQEYILGLMLSFILSGKAPYIDPKIIDIIKQELKGVDSSMQVEVKNIILQNLYMEYNMNDMMKKDINFAQEYDKNTLQGTYNNQKFDKKANDEGFAEDPFAILDILRYFDKKENTPLADVFIQEYLPTQQSTYFITGMEALSIAQFLASRKQANMPDIVVSNLVIEVPLLKQLNQKYRFTRLSFFLFLQELYSQICAISKATTLHIAEQIVRGQTKVQTLTNKDEEAQAKLVFDYFSNGQISFKKIIHPEFLMHNNVAMVALQLGDTITEGAEIISTNAYLRLIFLIKENFSQYVNEFEFDNLYVVTLSNNKRVGELRDANEEAYAVQYAQLANENADYLKALSEYIWIKDALVTILEKPITLSVYNRTMTILKEQYGKQVQGAIVNPNSVAQKTNEMLTTEELQKKKTNQALGWGTAAFVLWKIFV